MTFKTLTKECLFYVYDVPHHTAIKPKVLAGITVMGTHSVVEGDQQISNTDWYLSGNYLRPYRGELQNTFDLHINFINEIAGIPKNSLLELGNYWFQQYSQGDFHDWHLHGDSVFSNVYYVDLPDGASKTTLAMNGIEFEVDVAEGQILTFPSCFVHCSKPNKTAVKTVVAFNYC